MANEERKDYQASSRKGGIALGMLATGIALSIWPVSAVFSGSFYATVAMTSLYMLAGGLIGGAIASTVSKPASAVGDAAHRRRKGVSHPIVASEDLGMEHIVREPGSKKATYVHDGKVTELDLSRKHYLSYQDMLADGLGDNSVEKGA